MFGPEDPDADINTEYEPNYECDAGDDEPDVIDQIIAQK
jgi:hypothetical protein